MNWHNFIFSQEKRDRVRRHVIFWLVWWLYFLISFYHYEQSGLQQITFEPWNLAFLIKSCLLLAIQITACYIFINYLLPTFMFKARYTEFVSASLIVSVLILLASYFSHRSIFPFVNKVMGYKPIIGNTNIWWTSITSGLLSTPKVITAAIAIKLVKRWWIKQKEKELLEKEKLMTDLQLLKAQINPKFLFLSLDNIYLQVKKKENGKAGMLLLKLANILSYMLYECNQSLVPLEREIEIIKDYLVLQKSTMAGGLDIDIAEKGEFRNMFIKPLILFPFIENGFSYMRYKKPEEAWMNVEFQIANSEMTMKLIHGKNVEYAGPRVNENAISKTLKRLDFYYDGLYELKATVEPDMMMTYLKITLIESGNQIQDEIYANEHAVYADE